MKLTNLEAAIIEAKRFLEKADELKKVASTYPFGDGQYMYGHPKEAGAVRRASMDLTRALAKLRNDN